MPLPGVSIVFGPNNSGKTAVARLPMFAAASLSRPDLLALHYHGVGFAPDFRSLANLDEPHPRLCYSVAWNAAGGTRSARVVLQLVSTSDAGEHVVPLEVDVDEKSVHRADLDSMGPWPDLIADPEVASVRKEMVGVLASSLHIPSARPGVASVYHLKGGVDLSSLGPADSPFLLAANPELLGAVSKWFEDTLHHNIAVDQVAFAFRLTTRAAERADVNMSAAGRGTQAALPIVTFLTAISLGVLPVDHVVVEEPEAHLHPSAHPAMADLILAAHSAGTRVVVETHSEALILRLRRRIAEEVVPPDAISLVYVDPSITPSFRIVPITRTGAVPDWPPGVFEYSLAEVDVLAEKMLGA